MSDPIGMLRIEILLDLPPEAAALLSESLDDEQNVSAALQLLDRQRGINTFASGTVSSVHSKCLIGEATLLGMLNKLWLVGARSRRTTAKDITVASTIEGVEDDAPGKDSQAFESWQKETTHEEQEAEVIPGPAYMSGSQPRSIEVETLRQKMQRRLLSSPEYEFRPRSSASESVSACGLLPEPYRFEGLAGTSAGIKSAQDVEFGYQPDNGTNTMLRNQIGEHAPPFPPVELRHLLSKEDKEDCDAASSMTEALDTIDRQRGRPRLFRQPSILREGGGWVSVIGSEGGERHGSYFGAWNGGDERDASVEEVLSEYEVEPSGGEA